MSDANLTISSLSALTSGIGTPITSPVAVAQLLDALEPPGPIKAHEMIVADKGELDSLMRGYLDSFRMPETRAKDAVRFILAALRAAPLRVTEEEFRELEASHPSYAYPFYGIADAARDLAIKPELGEAASVTLPLQLSLTGEATRVTVSGVPQSSFDKIKSLEEPKQ